MNRKPHPVLLLVGAFVALAPLVVGGGYFLYTMVQKSLMARGSHYEAPPPERAAQKPFGKYQY